MGSVHRIVKVSPLAMRSTLASLMSANEKRGKQCLHLITHKIQLDSLGIPSDNRATVMNIIFRPKTNILT